MTQSDTGRGSKIVKREVTSSVGSNLVRFGGSFGFLRFGRFEVRFLGPKKRFGRFEVRF